MNREDADHFAIEWIRSWTARDIERIVSHFAERARFVSPLAARRTGNREVVGRDALREYWSGARSYSTFEFTLDRIIWDQDRQELAIIYEREVEGRRDRACELLRFNSAGEVVAGEAMYGAEIV